jgi:choline dehydrogenase-like flavoprotein
MLCFIPSTPTHTICAVIPASYRNKVGKPQYDWNFSTVGAPFSVHSRPDLGKGASNEWEIHELGTVRSANPKPIIGHPAQYRGKGLGGSSSVNSFLFHRPSAADINGASLAKVPSSLGMKYLSHTIKHSRS